MILKRNHFWLSKNTHPKFRNFHMEANRCLYIDTHCNIPNILQKIQLPVSKESFEKLRSQFVFTSSKKHNLSIEFEKCISVSSDAPSEEDTFNLIQSVDSIYGAFGIHPLYAGFPAF